ncbi:hypothetical protein PGT21_021939 [Puccinia graminis f. sp. tritici]|uniref:Uncharacterized protein n=1 Tax=Puccinia graminis f. sp. tritici TaxID=56615 RepID=A0A5B0RJA1_PUCGR|nr:hypothetical protein PGT21_021939 [Puccinia graminis f. sp. tritici]KAA1125757.1 hypothetical protein PGTUg99_014987 [Puccinia graminis f. sp. tritici]
MNIGRLAVVAVLQCFLVVCPILSAPTFYHATPEPLNVVGLHPSTSSMDPAKELSSGLKTGHVEDPVVIRGPTAVQTSHLEENSPSKHPKDVTEAYRPHDLNTPPPKKPTGKWKGRLLRPFKALSAFFKKIKTKISSSTSKLRRKISDKLDSPGMQKFSLLVDCLTLAMLIHKL